MRCDVTNKYSVCYEILPYIEVLGLRALNIEDIETERVLGLGLDLEFVMVIGPQTVLPALAQTSFQLKVLFVFDVAFCLLLGYILQPSFC